jgi:hypothetical protein
VHEESSICGLERNRQKKLVKQSNSGRCYVTARFKVAVVQRGALLLVAAAGVQALFLGS